MSQFVISAAQAAHRRSLLLNVSGLVCAAVGLRFSQTVLSIVGLATIAFAQLASYFVNRLKDMHLGPVAVAPQPESAPASGPAAGGPVGRKEEAGSEIPEAPEAPSAAPAGRVVEFHGAPAASPRPGAAALATGAPIQRPGSHLEQPITVRVMSGPTFTVFATPNDTIAFVKRSIVARVPNLEAACLTLKYKGKIFLDSQTLRECGVQFLNCEVVHVINRARGGKTEDDSVLVYRPTRQLV